jgi:hypothetical protein
MPGGTRGTFAAVGCGHRSGLANLGQWAAVHGGSCTLTAARSGGAELSWRVPLPSG